jgi:uncharacterized coiled-coil DUF342 family protein
MSDEEERLAELDEVENALRSRKAELERTLKRWADERDKLNESVRALRIEAQKHRDMRDQVNQRSSKLRQCLDGLLGELSRKHDERLEVESVLEEERGKLPTKKRVEEQLKRIEWKVMTTPTADMLVEEESLLKEAGDLRLKLAAHEELDKREDEKLHLLADIKAVDLKIKRHRNEISKLIEDSKINHEKMIILHSKADGEREQADSAHKKFLEHLSALRTVDADLKKLMMEKKKLSERLREQKQKTEAERERDTKNKMREMQLDAKRKLESGKKISLEEYKLLYGNENIEET